MDKICFIAKTNLNVDGRILNQINIITKNNPDLRINFLILEDKPTIIDLEEKVKIFPIKPVFRNSRILRLFTVFEFTVKALILLFKLNPKIVHVQDSAVVLPIWLYRKFKIRNFKLIYDDHEIPNENENLQYKIFNVFENKLMKVSDIVISANEERKEWLKNKLRLDKDKMKYFLNLPLDFYTEGKDKTKELIKNLETIDSYKSKNKIIMHQGSLEEERGREKLSNFVKNLPNNIKVLIIGVNEVVFHNFIEQFNLKVDSFIYLGYINYHELNFVWEKVDASVVMYLPTYINNRLCAPNRFYISLKYNLPIIVNKNNPVLENFVLRHKCGVFIEDLKTEENILNVFKIKYEENVLAKLQKDQVDCLLEIYNKFL